MLCVPFECKNVSSENTGVYEQLNRNDIGCIVCWTALYVQSGRKHQDNILEINHSEIYKCWFSSCQF